jgi:hypothetical protein
MTKIDLTIIFKTMPNFHDYMTEKQRTEFMNNDDGFIGDLQAWKETSRSLLRYAKEQLEEILNSQLMKEASRFAPWVKERWQGQLAVVLELLNEVDKETLP